MQYTEKLGLKLPEGSDNYDIADMNYNSNILDDMKSAKFIDKYYDVDGEYNEELQKVEFVNELDFTNIENNQRVLINPSKLILSPATNLQKIKSSTSLPNASYYYAPKCAKLTSGNVAVVSRDRGYATVIDESGTVIRNFTPSSTQYNNIVALDNDKFAIFGCNSTETSYDNYSSYLAIWDSSGTTYANKSPGMMRAGGNILKLSNGNILTVASYWRNSSGNASIWFKVFDQNGNELYLSSSDVNMWQDIELFELDNGNIMILAFEGQMGASHFMIIDNQCNIIKSRTRISNIDSMQYKQGIKLLNGNIFIINNGYYIIYDEDGNIVKDRTATTGSNCISLKNGNIATYGDRAFSIMSPSGTVIKSSTSLGNNFYNTQLMQMSNGNIIAFGTTSGSSSTKPGHAAIIDLNGNIVLNDFLFGEKYLLKSSVELDNLDLFIAGSNGYSSNDSQYCILKPYADSGSASLNGITLDTLLMKDKYYELVYKEESDKFIAEEVRA